MLWNNIRKLFSTLLFITLALFLLRVYETTVFLNSAVDTEAVIVNIPGNGYVFRFETENMTRIETTPVTSLLFNPADNHHILYNQLIPAQAKINNFIQIWYQPFFYATLFLSLITLMWTTSLVMKSVRKKRNRLALSGNHILTKYKYVEALVEKTKKGKHPYRIISAWKDRNTGKEFEFKSEPIWFNPMEYIMDQTIKVIIDQKNKKKYMMDLSFLPDHLIKN